jgi:HD-GYP domain-containing protein (c-di-GMP phosphodiesterase class II)
VRSCHERWDGKGYPDQLKGEQIPLAARIVFVCDAYNAMTTDRPYRASMTPEAALKELIENSGTQFDPMVVAGLVSVIERGALTVTSSDGVRALLANRPTPEGAGAAS